MTLTDAELHLARQWFDAVEDLLPGYLEPEDYRLAHKLFIALGMRPSHRLSDAAGQPRQDAAGPETALDVAPAGRDIDITPGKAWPAWFMVDAATFPPGETRHVRLTELGKIYTYRVTGEDAGDGLTRCRLCDPIDTKDAP